MGMIIWHLIGDEESSAEYTYHLISHDGNNNIYVHDGFSDTIIDTFPLETFMRDITLTDAGNFEGGLVTQLSTTSGAGIKIRDGLSASIVDSFATGGSPRGIACSNGGNLIAINNSTADIHTGITSTVGSTFGIPTEANVACVHPIDGTLYVAPSAIGVISIYNIGSSTVIDTVPAIGSQTIVIPLE